MFRPLPGHHQAYKEIVLIKVHSLVCILLGISPASDCGLPTFRNSLSVPSSRAGCEVLSILHTSHPAYEDGTDRVFRNVGIQQSDVGEIPKRIHTIFKTRRKFEIKNTFVSFSNGIPLFILQLCFYILCKDGTL